MEKRARDNSERKWISIISLVIGVGLLFLKFYAFQVTHSQSIYSDALESIVNVVAGVITLIVIAVAAKPADDDHPYGHGKVESMAASFEGGAISLAGLLIILQAVDVFYRGVQLQELDVGLMVTTFAGLVNGGMGYIIWLRGKRLHSEALQSSGTHLMTDALTSIGVIISLFLVKWTGMTWIDPILAITFGFMLCLSGVKILIRSGNILLDGHDEETLQKIADLFEQSYVPGVIDLHYTRVMRSGNFHHVDCHMVIPEFWSISHAHHFSEEFEKRFIESYELGAELKIHLDPCRRVYCENCELQDCPIRERPFKQRKALNDLKEVTSPTESR